MPRLASGRASWITHLLDNAVDESNRRRPGGEAVRERMSEMMFVEALRRYRDEMPPGRPAGWPGCATPAWAARCHCSMGGPATPGRSSSCVRRPAFRARSCTNAFVQFLGLAPMQYLGQWRMQLAAGMLRNSDSKIIEVALDVGYERGCFFARVQANGGRDTRSVAAGATAGRDGRSERRLQT